MDDGNVRQGKKQYVFPTAIKSPSTQKGTVVSSLIGYSLGNGISRSLHQKVDASASEMMRSVITFVFTDSQLVKSDRFTSLVHTRKKLVIVFTSHEHIQIRSHVSEVILFPLFRDKDTRLPPTHTVSCSWIGVFTSPQYAQVCLEVKEDFIAKGKVLDLQLKVLPFTGPKARTVTNKTLEKGRGKGKRGRGGNKR